MPRKYEWFFFLGGALLLALSVGIGIRGNFFRSISSPTTPLSPVGEQTLGAKVKRFSPFSFLLRNGGSNAKETRPLASGPSDQIVPDAGLLDRFLKGLTDTFRSTPTPTPTPTPSPTVLALTTTPAPALSGAQELIRQQVEMVRTLLLSQNYNGLYNLLSGEFKNNFSLSEFQQSFAGASAVTRLELLEAPLLSGEWAEAKIRLTLEGAERQRTFLAVFHYEGGGWLLFGTEEVL